jgi:hypothetical protein
MQACPGGVSIFQLPRALDAGLDASAPPGDAASLPDAAPVDVRAVSDGEVSADAAPSPVDAPTPPTDTVRDAPVDLPIAADAAVTDCPGGIDIRCRGICVHQVDDPANCGVCDMVCSVGVACVRGACALDCIPGLTRCPSGCAFTQTDPANCAGCGATCVAGQVCSNSGCEDTCTEGFSMCQVTGSDGIARDGCANLGADPLNCGGCGNVCRGGERCVSRMCQP